MKFSGQVANTAQPSATRFTGSGWMSLTLLTLTYAVYTIDKFVLSIIIEPLKREFALSDSQLGLLTGLATNLPFLLTCIPLAMLADRINRKWLLVALVVLWSLSTGLGGIATSVTFLIISRAVVGGLEAGFTPLALSILGDRFPPQRRSTAMGVFNVGATLGVFVALSVGGMIVAAHGWRWAFFIAGTPGIIMGVLLAVLEREPPRSAFDPGGAAAQPEKRAGLVDAFLSMWRAPVVRYGATGLVLFAALPAVCGTWLPSLLIRVHHFPVQEAGFGAAIVGLVTAIGAGVGGAFSDWLGRRDDWRKLLAPLYGCSIAIVLGLLGLFAAPNGTVAVTLLAMMGFLHAAYAGVGYAVVLGNSPARVRSTIMAIVLMAANLISGGLSNTIVGFISDSAASTFGETSILYGFATAFIFTFGGLMVTLAGMRELRRVAEAERA